jgi:hypothetical protein
MHFHLLGSCPECYVRDSSFHHSFYRCISIHGTHQVTVSENVAYDVTGFCYYLEDGVEENNTLSYNLAAHIHAIGSKPPGAIGQNISVTVQGPRLLLPADISASGFYITNVHNNLIGNAASGVSAPWSLCTNWTLPSRTHCLFLYSVRALCSIGLGRFGVSHASNGTPKLSSAIVSSIVCREFDHGWQHGTLVRVVVGAWKCILLWWITLLQ